jgi:hypothetical protein
VSLLERTIEAHGGREAWHGREGFEIEASAGGVAWPMRTRRKPGSFRARLVTERPWMEVFDYPEPGSTGVFEPDVVRIGDVERRDPRAAFEKLRRQVHWDDLDLLYFAGYAWWNYMAFPFMLERPGFEVEERPGRVLAVRFPDGFPTHSPEQLYHLDEQHRLVRHDYTAHVFGAWARAKHLSSEHRFFDGLLVPTKRRVYMRGTRFPVIISLDVKAVRASA